MFAGWLAWRTWNSLFNRRMLFFLYTEHVSFIIKNIEHYLNVMSIKILHNTFPLDSRILTLLKMCYIRRLSYSVLSLIKTSVQTTSFGSPDDWYVVYFSLFGEVYLWVRSPRMGSLGMIVFCLRSLTITAVLFIKRVSVLVLY